MIKLVNVSKYYSSNNVVALGLRKVNLELSANEFVAIVGESGSGKTTLLNVICGIDTYEEGEMYINGEETSYFATSDMENYRKKYVAFVFQNYNLIDSYTVLQNVEAPLLLAGYPKKDIRARALEIIRRVGLEKHIKHKATKLSGGQKQRVVIARALAKDCPIIAADEPTGNLDSESGKQIMELLYEISKEKLVVLVTHDYEQVKEYATRRIRIYDGEVVEDVEVKKTNKQDLPKLDDVKMNVRFWENWMFALRNLLSVPKKTLLMIVIFSFFSFFVALSYGAFLGSMRDFDSSYNFYFQNTSITRVIVRKADKSALTEADLNELRGLNLVETVVPYDFILDQQTYLEDKNDPENWSKSVNAMFLPLTLAKAEHLVHGVMPQAVNEVVIALPSSMMVDAESYLGITYAFSSYWGGFIPNTHKNLIVTGVINADTIHMKSSGYSRSAFFMISEPVLFEYQKLAYRNYMTSSIFEGTNNEGGPVLNEQVFGWLPTIIDNSLVKNKILLPDGEQGMLCFGVQTLPCVLTGDFTVKDFYSERIIDGVTIEFYTTNKDYGVKMSQETVDQFFPDGIYQVSVIASSDVGVKGLVTRISLLTTGLLSSKYKVFYPYASEAGDPFSALMVLLSVIGATLTMAITLIASTLITYIIFRAIINTKMHDYAIFRTIGANQKMITDMIYMENIITAVIGFFIVLGATMWLRSINSMFVSILKFYDFFSYLILFAVLILMALFISRKYCKRIFKESVSKTLKAE